MMNGDNNSSGFTQDGNHSESAPLYNRTSDKGSLRIIVAFFFVFSLALTLSLSLQLYYGSPYQLETHGSVVSDNAECTDAGVNMLKKGGNSVDAVIATSFCMGVVNPHITGLGSCGLMMIYDHRERNVLHLVDFLCMRSSDAGIGLPGFVAGLFRAHELYGVLPWVTLLEPAIAVARNGFIAPSTLVDAKSSIIQNENRNEALKEWLSPITTNETIYSMNLANVLDRISTHGPDAFYNNTLRDDLQYLERDFVDHSFIDDINKYEVLNGEREKLEWGDFDIFIPAKSSGSVTMRDILANSSGSPHSLLELVKRFQTIDESWKITTASHVAAFDANDLYVSVVSGLGSVLGSQFLTESGYILNNAIEETEDRSSRRPSMHMMPLVAIQRSEPCGKRFTIGGGDVRDVLQVLTKLVSPTRNASRIIDAINEPRVRIIGTQIALESGSDWELSTFDQTQFEENGYLMIKAARPYPSINIIFKERDEIFSYADPRGGGLAITF